LSDQATYLGGLRVLELADELGEYCGKFLTGLGADVIKVEPPGGEVTRTYGPFFHDTPDRDRSLHFWHYNLGKRGIVLDLDVPDGLAQFRSLASVADIIVDTRPPNYLRDRAVGYDDLKVSNPGLVYARISPFGDDGPWSGRLGSDLVHLALGGVMMNCGYDPEPSGFYDTPPIAPQMWQAYHIAGEMATMGILAALIHRANTGDGQRVSTTVHEAVAMNTETDLPNWTFLRQAHRRLTCRHSLPPTSASAPALQMSKDGRWVLPYQTYLTASPASSAAALRLLRKWEMREIVTDRRFDDEEYVSTAEGRARIAELTQTLVGRLKFERKVWLDAQGEGLPWAPIARPEENATEEHWRIRGAIVDVTHPEVEGTFDYVGSRWYSPTATWQIGARAPMLGEHTSEVMAQWGGEQRSEPKGEVVAVEPEPHGYGAGEGRGEPPFVLEDIRVVDLSWFLASAGAGRFLAAFGAEVIKVEHSSRLDAMRWSQGKCPPGGRAQRDAATEPIPPPDPAGNPNRGGAFMEINAGKLGLSLNLKSGEGRELLTRLIEVSDVLIEGFSPGTMDRMGFGYERLREINPRIIYVQQSGVGQFGTIGELRTFGPTAAGFAGTSEMSGLPDPYPPAGIGYSYLDWFGAYNVANAVLASLYRRQVTGEGTYIDASQIEVGLYLSGTAVLDHSANRRQWRRYGNRSPYKPAAPHGAYRTLGQDRWIAIACFDDAHWSGVLSVLANRSLVEDPRFLTLAGRLAHQAALDEAMTANTQAWDPFELMERLQAAGVPAGVCQTAQDRYEADPQLAHLGWMEELPQTEIGRWPVKRIPIDLSRSPARVGGIRQRSGPNYAEDNEYVLRDILKLEVDEIERLKADGSL
jgi:crotonobetainyl-CoA:carnitine CoA-transferase CaiB-like acyl-CoA transferase